MENVLPTIWESKFETPAESEKQRRSFLSIKRKVSYDVNERDYSIAKKMCDVEVPATEFKACIKQDPDLKKEEDDHNTNFSSNDQAYVKMELDEEEQAPTVYIKEEIYISSDDESLDPLNGCSSDIPYADLEYHNVISTTDNVHNSSSQICYVNVNNVNAFANDNPKHELQVHEAVDSLINHTSDYFKDKNQDYRESVNCMPGIDYNSSASHRNYLDHILSDNKPVTDSANQNSVCAIEFVDCGTVMDSYGNSNFSEAYDTASNVEFTKSLVPSAEDSEIHRIKEWVISHNVSKEQTDDLLQILQPKILPNAPVTGEALINNTSESAIAYADALYTMKERELFEEGICHKSSYEENDAEEIAMTLKMKNNIMNSSMNYIQFMTKYRIRLPIDTVEGFELFDLKIKMDHEFYRDLSALIVSRLSEFGKLWHVLLPVMQLVFTKNVMGYFLMKRRTVYLTKMAFFKTAFSDCLFKVIKEYGLFWCQDITEIDYVEAILLILRQSRFG